MKHLIIQVLISASLCISMNCYAASSNCSYQANKIIKLSLSSNGNYAISSSSNQEIILWNLKKHSYKIISKNGNPFSAYYIKNSPYFIWQSLDHSDITNHGEYIGGENIINSDSCFDYVALKRIPNLKEISLVKSKELFILSNYSGKYYMFFPFGSKYGYKKIMISKNNFGYKYMKKLFSDQNYFDFFAENKETRKQAWGSMPVLGTPSVSFYTYFGEVNKINQIARRYGFDANNTVHVQSPYGQEKLRFNNFPVYSEVMTPDLRSYYATDIAWNLMSGYGNDQRKIMHSLLDINYLKPESILDDTDALIVNEQNYYRTHKTLSLLLSPNNKYLLSSGTTSLAHYPVGKSPSDRNILNNFNSLTLWSKDNGRYIKKRFIIFKDNPPNKILNDGPTVAAIDPNNRYMISSDSSGDVIFWSLQSVKQLYVEQDTDFFNKKSAPLPYDYDTGVFDPTINMKFISNQHFLRFVSPNNYAILYNVHSKYPEKFIDLGKQPYQFIKGRGVSYMQEGALDTAPKKGILVMARSDGNGIIEYKYNSKNKTLNRVWVASLH